MSEYSTEERRILREVYNQTPEFRERLRCHLENRDVRCEFCGEMVGVLHTVPGRLRPYIGFTGFSVSANPVTACAYCIAEASTQKNRLAERDRSEQSGVITFSVNSSWFGPAALSNRPDLDGNGGQVYLARHEDVVKIGATTRDAVHRINALGGRDVYQLVMTLSLRCPFTLEKYLHQRYLRLREHGEHFRLGTREVDFIGNIRQFNGEPVVVDVLNG